MHTAQEEAGPEAEIKKAERRLESWRIHPMNHFNWFFSGTGKLNVLPSLCDTQRDENKQNQESKNAKEWS